MLRLVKGATKLDGVRNKYGRTSLGVVNIVHKLEDNGLWWLRFVVRREQVHITSG